MQRPKNLDDFSQCVKVLPDRTIVFCVECDNWHSVEIEAMARVEIRHNGIKTIEIDEKEIKLCCAVCGSDIEYLLVNNVKSQVIKRFHNVKVIVSKERERRAMNSIQFVILRHAIYQNFIAASAPIREEDLSLDDLTKIIADVGKDYVERNKRGLYLTKPIDKQSHDNFGSARDWLGNKE